MRYAELMGYIYIYTSQPPQETLFFNPPPFEILVVYSNFLGFCFSLYVLYDNSLLCSGISVKVLRFMLYAWRGGITYPLFFFSHRFKPLNLCHIYKTPGNTQTPFKSKLYP